MKDVVSISFVFENCESVDIDAKHIGDFTIENITEQVSRIACNAISKYKRAVDFCIEISKNADISYNPYSHIELKQTVFDRIEQWNDITSIEIKFDDGTAESIYTVWGGDSEQENSYQKSKRTSEGNLYLKVSDKPFEYFFNLEEYDDEFRTETLQHIENMYSES